ncbi:MAG: HlyD family secretion protein [Balneolales bacterium]|nr:HlyD family secretion protein [Balneolales bacterium]
MASDFNGKKYEPVPIPASTKWREFRIRIIPILIFLAAVLIIFFLWERRVQSPDFIGYVYAPQYVITAQADGIISEIYVQDFDKVEHGSPVAQIKRGLAEELEARLALINSEINHILTSGYPAESAVRAYVDLLGLKTDAAEMRAERAELREQILFLEANFRRQEQLFASGFSEQVAFELAEAEMKAAKARMEELNAEIIELEKSISTAMEMADLNSSSRADMIESAVSVQRVLVQLTEKEFGSYQLNSSGSGIVQFMKRSPGEFVSRGDTIAVVQSPRPESIIGMIRQPLSISPEPGMMVEIRSRKIQRNRYTAQISNVGGQFRPIDQAMQRPGLSFESGLPVRIELSRETDFDFIPGEFVDLILMRN